MVKYLSGCFAVFFHCFDGAVFGDAGDVFIFPHIFSKAQRVEFAFQQFGGAVKRGVAFGFGLRLDRHRTGECRQVGGYEFFGNAFYFDALFGRVLNFEHKTAEQKC